MTMTVMLTKPRGLDLVTRVERASIKMPKEGDRKIPLV